MMLMNSRMALVRVKARTRQVAARDVVGYTSANLSYADLYDANLRNAILNQADVTPDIVQF